jgi:hypothetical protein
MNAGFVKLIIRIKCGLVNFIIGTNGGFVKLIILTICGLVNFIIKINAD